MPFRKRLAPAMVLMALPVACCGFQVNPQKTMSFTLPSLQPNSAIRRRSRGTDDLGSARSSSTECRALALDGATSAIDNFFQTQPYMAAFMTCSFKASAADFVAQIRGSSAEATTEDDDIDLQSTRNGVSVSASNAETATATLELTNDSAVAPTAPVDLPRNLAFVAYGGLYQGVFQEFLYGVMFPQWFDNSIQSIAIQVCLDNLFIGPFICMPIAYLVKSIVTSSSSTTTTDNPTPEDLIRAGLDHYVEDVTQRGILFKYWAIWLPVQTLTFGVIPHHFRIAFIALFSFLWMFILSTVSAMQQQQQQQLQEKQQQ